MVGIPPPPPPPPPPSLPALPFPSLMLHIESVLPLLQRPFASLPTLLMLWRCVRLWDCHRSCGPTLSASSPSASAPGASGAQRLHAGLGSLSVSAIAPALAASFLLCSRLWCSSSSSSSPCLLETPTASTATTAAQPAGGLRQHHSLSRRPRLASQAALLPSAVAHISGTRRSILK